MYLHTTRSYVIITVAHEPLSLTNTTPSKKLPPPMHLLPALYLPPPVDRSLFHIPVTVCVPGGRRQQRRTEPADSRSVRFVRRRQTVLGNGVQLRWYDRHAAKSRTTTAAAATIVRFIIAVRFRYDASPPLVIIVVVVPLGHGRCLLKVAPSRHRRDRPTAAAIVVPEIRFARLGQRLGDHRGRTVLQKAHPDVTRHGQDVVLGVRRIVLFLRTQFSDARQPTQVRAIFFGGGGGNITLDPVARYN